MNTGVTKLSECGFSRRARKDAEATSDPGAGPEGPSGVEAVERSEGSRDRPMVLTPLVLSNERFIAAPSMTGRVVSTPSSTSEPTVR